MPTGKTQAEVMGSNEKQTVSTDVEQQGVGTSTDVAQAGAGTSTDGAKTNPFAGIDSNIEALTKAREQYESANETPQQQEKRERKERSKRIVAAVGDGLRALSNLYFTSQYAPQHV